jgi:hypothetical protein
MTVSAVSGGRHIQNTTEGTGTRIGTRTVLMPLLIIKSARVGQSCPHFTLHILLHTPRPDYTMHCNAP